MEVFEIQNIQQEESDMALLVQRMGQEDYDRLILAMSPSSNPPEERLELTREMVTNQLILVESEAQLGANSLSNLYAEQCKVNKLLEEERIKETKNLYEIKRLEALIHDLDKQVELSLNYLAVLARLTVSLLDTLITIVDIYLKNS